MNIEILLDKFQLKQNQLSPEEKITLENWVAAINQNEITVDRIKIFINGLVENVEKEMTEYSPKTIIDLLFMKRRKQQLDARLRCYLMLREFLSTPERAKQAMERAIQNIKK